LRAFAKADIAVALAARTVEDLSPLAAETGAKLFVCNATDRKQVTKLFGDVKKAIGAPDAVVREYLHSARTGTGAVELPLAAGEPARITAVAVCNQDGEQVAAFEHNLAGSWLY